MWVCIVCALYCVCVVGRATVKERAVHREIDVELDPAVATLHAIRPPAELGYDRDCEAADIEEEIETWHPGLLSHLKRGDAVMPPEWDAGRSAGAWFVECADPLSIVPRSFEFDEYGTQPLEFCVPEFPPGYFNNFQLNNAYRPGHYCSLCWHSGKGYDVYSEQAIRQMTFTRYEWEDCVYVCGTYTHTDGSRVEELDIWEDCFYKHPALGLLLVVDREGNCPVEHDGAPSDDGKDLYEWILARAVVRKVEERAGHSAGDSVHTVLT